MVLSEHKKHGKPNDIVMMEKMLDISTADATVAAAVAVEKALRK